MVKLCVKIIFENNDLVVVDKPAGWLSVPSRMGAKDSRPCVGIELKKKLRIRLFPVHRLDIEVSGLLVFAKSDQAQRRLSEAFENRKVEKIYEAVTEDRGNVQTPAPGSLFEDKILRGKKRAYIPKHGDGKIAETRVLESRMLADGRRFWRLQPLTGRPHQLRFQLASRGFPVLGDVLYSGTKLGGTEISLRAVRIKFLESGLEWEVEGLKSLETPTSCPK